MTYSIPFHRRVLGHLVRESAEQFGDRPFLTVDGRCHSFRAVHERSQSLARGLRGLGVRRGEPVIVMFDNSVQFILAWFAIVSLDAVCVPVNTAYSGELLSYVLRDTRARWALASGRLAPAFAGLERPLRGDLHTLVVHGEAGPIDGLRVLDWQEACNDAGDPVVSTAAPSDTTFICYTSGTTGPSKGVTLAHSVVLQTTESFINAVGMSAEDIVFSPLPLFHGMSRSMATLPALLLGTQVHLAPRFSATSFWRDVRASGATISTTIFTIPPLLKSKPPSEDDRAHRVRVMFNAHHDEEFEARFGVRLVEAHAMTETGMTIFTPYPQRRLGASGQAGPDWEVRLVDEDGRAVPPGAIGELAVQPRREGILMGGYLNKPEATAEAMRGGWFHTGDLMRADEDGYYYFCGRKKERIRRRGENVSAYEVEAIAGQHPEIACCAVMGVPAGDNEDEVYLCAVLRQPDAVAAPTLHEWLSARLPRFMVPRFIEFREALPMTPSAKVEKHTLARTLPAPGAWDCLQ